MFEDLIQRSNSLHTEVKESITISNHTRQEVREGLRVMSQNRLRQSFTSSVSSGSTMTSSETMCTLTFVLGARGSRFCGCHINSNLHLLPSSGGHCRGPGIRRINEYRPWATNGGAESEY